MNGEPANLFLLEGGATFGLTTPDFFNGAVIWPLDCTRQLPFPSFWVKGSCNECFMF